MAYAQITHCGSHSSPTRDHNWPAWLDRADYPFESRYLAVDGHQMHYVDEGTGPVLLFLHANPLWSFQYRKFIRTLRPNFRCIALDFPGFGLSCARADYVNTLTGASTLVERFMQTLALSDVTLVAHDSSVSIGLGVVARQPDWFRALVLSNGFAWPLTEDPSINRFIRIVASPLFRFMVVNFNFLLRYTAAHLDLSPSEKRAYLMPYADRSRRRHQHDFFRSIVNSTDYLQDLKSRLPYLRHLSVLLAFADADPTYQAGWMQRYQTLFPRHHTVKIEGSHHFPQEYDAETMTDAIQKWWEKEFSVDAETA